MNRGSSYGQILRATSIIGGATVVRILVGLLRTKAAALLLGPAGLGLIGLFQSVVDTAASLSSLGFGTVGTRQIAEANASDDRKRIVIARRALSLGTFALALFGGYAVFLLRNVLATTIIHDAAMAKSIGWLAVGVVLTVAASSQSALLNGLQRIGDIARISVASAILSTSLGLAALYFWRERGVVAFIVAAPFSSFLLGHFYVSKLPRTERTEEPTFAALLPQWHALARLGLPFMLAGTVVTLGMLAVRSLIQKELGPAPLGQFQASWMISMTYIGFILTAMGTDYYPRLTAAITDRKNANQLVNEQTEVAVLLAGPIFLAMLGLAPLVVRLLYSSAFGEAATILRWQVLGDALKIASWPLSYILLAAGAGRTFLLAESLSISVFLTATYVGLPLVGIQATGISFLCMYTAYLPVVYWLAKRRTGFSWTARVRRDLVSLIASLVFVFLMATWHTFAGALSGCFLAMLFATKTLARFAKKASPGSRLAGLMEKFDMILRRMGIKI